MTIRNETLVESVSSDLELTLPEAQALAAAGRKLALKRLVASVDGDEDDEPTLIRCAMNPNGTWRVTVSDAVGLVAVGDLRLLVEPKIPRPHLFHLFHRSELLPRIDPTQASAGAGMHLWELMAGWLVQSLEQVIRRELVRDYLPFRDTLQVARGQIDPLGTAQAYYQGSLQLVCDFEEFGSNTPLNRVLKAAALAVGASTELSTSLRRRAIAVAARMEDVGRLRTADLRATLDRRSAHCLEALTLARNVLANIRRTLQHGEKIVWTFLIRTPELVETGVRNELRERLDHKWQIRKETIPLVGAKMNVAPDLLFGYGDAIGDVKYKLASARWLRADLYEIVAFAAAAGTSRAAIIGFRSATTPQPPSVSVGGTQVRYFAWLADEDVTPLFAANSLAAEITAWLESPSA